MQRAKTLIRLGGCWADTGHIRSFCWFCHASAHMLFFSIQITAVEDLHVIDLWVLVPFIFNETV